MKPLPPDTDVSEQALSQGASSASGEARSEPGRCIAVFGTGSDVGKSVIAAGLCRVFSDAGYSVAPFKAQNMSNNSWVTCAGGEMGRAQVVQAQAARAEPHTDMNPVLLKPSTDVGAQVVLHGRPVGTRAAGDYFRDTTALAAESCGSLDRLRSAFEVVVIEGAGSCAEVNLRATDFVNFRTAHAAEAPVILVADIDRGGVFAQIIGTLDVLPDEDRERIAGFIVNRFRGDLSLFEDGVRYLEERTSLPVYGVVPYYRHIEIESEDALPLDVQLDPQGNPRPDLVSIAVIRVPHISNFTDFDALGRETHAELHYLAAPRDLKGYDLVVLPGTKNTRFDLDWLRSTGWVKRLDGYRALGGSVAGICGGYQMLGAVVRDPLGVEGAPGETDGLAYLDCVTALTGEKALTRTQGVWIDLGVPVEGYEIHMGVTEQSGPEEPLLRVTRRQDESVEAVDGARSEDGRVWGTYLHGVFDNPLARRAVLRRLRPDLEYEAESADAGSVSRHRDQQYDLLADHLRAHLDIPAIAALLGIPAQRLQRPGSP